MILRGFLGALALGLVGISNANVLNNSDFSAVGPERQSYHSFRHGKRRMVVGSRLVRVAQQ
jgi:hypothetical protein